MVQAFWRFDRSRTLDVTQWILLEQATAGWSPNFATFCRLLGERLSALEGCWQSESTHWGHRFLDGRIFRITTLTVVPAFLRDRRLLLLWPWWKDRNFRWRSCTFVILLDSSLRSNSYHINLFFVLFIAWFARFAKETFKYCFEGKLEKEVLLDCITNKLIDNSLLSWGACHLCHLIGKGVAHCRFWEIGTLRVLLIDRLCDLAT